MRRRAKALAASEDRFGQEGGNERRVAGPRDYVALSPGPPTGEALQEVVWPVRASFEMQTVVPLLAHLIGPVVYLDPNPVGIEDEEGVVAREVRFLLRRQWIRASMSKRL